jgi:predicted transposase YbfD/YdcC
MGELICEHRSIENQLHWVLAVVFEEDGDRKRKNQVPEDVNV